MMCETCETLKREIEWWKRVDYRTWRDKAAELLRHQLEVHKHEEAK